MPFENQILTFSEWFWGHPLTKFSPFLPKTWGELGFFFGTIVIVFFVSLIVSFLWYLIAAMQHGPSEGFYLVAKAIFGSFTEDLPRFSLRRTMAIARLAVQEAIRNKVLIGFEDIDRTEASCDDDFNDVVVYITKDLK